MSRSWCILFDGRILGGGEYLMQNLSFSYKVSLHKVSFERQAENQTFGRKCGPGLKAKAYPPVSHIINTYTIYFCEVKYPIISRSG